MDIVDRVEELFRIRIINHALDMKQFRGLIEVLLKFESFIPSASNAMKLNPECDSFESLISANSKHLFGCAEYLINQSLKESLSLCHMRIFTKADLYKFDKEHTSNLSPRMKIYRNSLIERYSNAGSDIIGIHKFLEDHRHTFVAHSDYSGRSTEVIGGRIETLDTTVAFRPEFFDSFLRLHRETELHIAYHLSEIESNSRSTKG